MTSIQQNIELITSQIAQAEQKCGRAQGDVQLLAVSKTKPIEAILDACQAGQRRFGENYVQEGVSKVVHFNEQHGDIDIEWHFIGPIQSNKTRPVAEHFDWVHTVDRAKIAQRLNDQRPQGMKPIQVLIQVNTSSEASKSGVDSEQVLELAQLISSLPNLTLRGVMSIPENVSDYQSQLIAFKALAEVKNLLAEKHPQVDTLSMGMSGDMEAAIEAGSTIVRIGTAIFGARDYSNKA
ncbi:MULTISPECIES: YggS family pyridoxal phosphate-dependent enzyme [Vibrio]|jgi:pyridoxal phosphate enzyme (YggS family)|uniref:Pyridoxal phosphate homeostasis protein n=1 Tax=Vibrio mediterranei TaxID=689 RepID=A0AAJ3EM14_9VIBR|nr:MULTISPECIES: YggS family pyridoxal phosphate-dependent enzyme [Vibrio]ASI89104.1 YggS family pyridoxal phosphate enzyme [Vibrio mediterranei]MCF4174141.1 YggS family pyridoxal phosphate-dependent enzyme [Vibrio sp. McD22-P3]MCG9626316.1 YggS family pyridoxal phosphate-dependent enzyme [Vibrio mediterranei]MCY9852875.1 YggS family pyridoxal phosphate-dependent enzyme [Vibrio mediterranei]MDA0110091.1 YggS family pyridoxal phosphate-dependent enzyme [Vibrio sp. La 4.2.2]